MRILDLATANKPHQLTSFVNSANIIHLISTWYPLTAPEASPQSLTDVDMFTPMVDVPRGHGTPNRCFLSPGQYESGGQGSATGSLAAPTVLKYQPGWFTVHEEAAQGRCSRRGHHDCEQSAAAVEVSTLLG